MIKTVQVFWGRSGHIEGVLAGFGATSTFLKLTLFASLSVI
ncbi:hypothetical protein M23134_07306 [Microscilla marina ATCC 23134]|uniref:Uncharacterized protein n=1 Tax=Microscilla marina ATCC 23134 TaxID=313606 RepID=A1ZVF7_MICM2|nr:hypothetical protein M23134_07306 [Microscilla marina ATCC 23134]